MKNKIIYSIFGILLLSIILPLLKPGYFFAIDQVFNPNGFIPKIGENVFWLGYLIKAFNFLHIPSFILEKILIILTFVLPAFGGYLLLKNTKNTYAIVFAMLFLIFNPFLYGRFLDGQINIYLSYALYPLFFYFLKNTFENTTLNNIFIVGFFTLFLCLTSLHNAIFLFFIFLVFFIFYFKKTGIKNIFKIGIVVILLNLVWFIPLILADNSNKFQLVNEVKNYGQENIEVFEVKPKTNIYLDLASLNGYWGENQSRFSPVWENKYYLVFFGILFFLFISGFFYKIEKSEFKNFEFSLIFIGFLSFIFAFGIKYESIFSFVNKLMYEYFPMYSGMRESHKWIMFLVFVYAYFGAFAIKNLTEKFQNLDNKFAKIGLEIIVIFLVLTPVFYVNKALFGFSGQVSIGDYPKTWEEIREIYSKKEKVKNCNYKEEQKSESCYNALALPRHHCMKFDFTEKIVCNWIYRYFGENILYGDNMEAGKIYSNSERLESKIMESYFGPNGGSLDLQKFYSDLNGLGINYVFLFKTVDYLKYKEVLANMINKGYLEVEVENKEIIFYKIK